MTYEETNKVSLQEAKNVVGIVIQAHLPLNTKCCHSVNSSKI